MLVKLGDVWVDPSRVEFLEPSLDKSSISISIVTPDRSTQSNGSIDDFASIINEALAPKQSWGEEISEPQVIPTAITPVAGGYSLKDNANETS